jgi:hypothetical protein
MGQCQRAGTSKNKKVTENFPPAGIFASGLRNKNSFKKSYLVPQVTNYECNFSLDHLKY